jgi:hypothetical protein
LVQCLLHYQKISFNLKYSLNQINYSTFHKSYFIKKDTRMKKLKSSKKVNYSYYFLLARLNYLSEAPSIENCIEDDLNEICDMTYFVKKMNEFSFIEI